MANWRSGTKRPIPQKLKIDVYLLSLYMQYLGFRNTIETQLLSFLWMATQLLFSLWRSALLKGGATPQKGGEGQPTRTEELKRTASKIIIKLNFSEITYPLSPTIKSIITVYVNVSYLQHTAPPHEHPIYYLLSPLAYL